MTSGTIDTTEEVEIQEGAEFNPEEEKRFASFIKDLYQDQDGDGEADYVTEVYDNDDGWFAMDWEDIRADHLENIGDDAGSRSVYRAAAALAQMIDSTDIPTERLQEIQDGTFDETTLTSFERDELIDSTKWYMSLFGNNVVGGGYMVAKLWSGTPEQIAAFGYLMDVHDSTSWFDAQGTARMVGMNAADPTSWTLFGKGAGKAGQIGAKALIKEMVKQYGLKMAGTAAVIGSGEVLVGDNETEIVDRLQSSYKEASTPPEMREVMPEQETPEITQPQSPMVEGFSLSGLFNVLMEQGFFAATKYALKGFASLFNSSAEDTGERPGPDAKVEVSFNGEDIDHDKYASNDVELSTEAKPLTPRENAPDLTPAA